MVQGQVGCLCIYAGLQPRVALDAPRCKQPVEEQDQLAEDQADDGHGEPPALSEEKLNSQSGNS